MGLLKVSHDFYLCDTTSSSTCKGINNIHVFCVAAASQETGDLTTLFKMGSSNSSSGIPYQHLPTYQPMWDFMRVGLAAVCCSNDFGQKRSKLLFFTTFEDNNDHTMTYIYGKLTCLLACSIFCLVEVRGSFFSTRAFLGQAPKILRKTPKESPNFW